MNHTDTEMDEEIPDFEGEWEAIIPFHEIHTPEIPIDVLPGWHGEFVQEVSECAQTPISFGITMMFAVLATCLQKLFVICPFDDSYIEPLNSWALGVMAPGTRKTFVLESLTAPLVEWESEQLRLMQPTIDEVAAVRAITMKRIEHLQARAAKCPDPNERAVLAREISDLKAQMPAEIFAPRLFTNDCTPERFQSLLAEHGERMAVISDEGGIFEVIGGLYSDGKSNIDIFLKSHSGSAVRVDRGSRTTHMDNPLSTFGLAVQPAIIEDLSKGSKRRFRGTGCLARFLYCVPQSNVGRRNAMSRQSLSDPSKETYASHIHSLLSIQPQRRDGEVQPYVLRLNDDARRSFLAYQQALEPRQGEAGDLASIADWTAKLPGQLLRLAALNHVAIHGTCNLTISGAELEPFLDLGDVLIQHASCAFATMGSDEVTADARHVARWIRNKRSLKLSQHDIYRGCHGRIKKMDRLLKALGILIDHHVLSEPLPLKTGGRPTTILYVNPEFLGDNE